MELKYVTSVTPPVPLHAVDKPLVDDLWAEAVELKRRLDTLIAATEPLIQLASDYNKDCGGCDHSVNVCMCGAIRTVEDAEDAMAVAKGIPPIKRWHHEEPEPSNRKET